MKILLNAAIGCNVGKRRANNEDNFYFNGNNLSEDNMGLDQILSQKCITDDPVDFGVFDGMGGQADGQVASFIASEVFKSERRGSQNKDANAFLSNIALKMNDAVWQTAEKNGSNMGTTASVLRFFRKEFCVCNVGDSPIFLLRQGILKEISKEHTDADYLKNNNITNRKPRLTQCIGIPPKEMLINPFTFKDRIWSDDQFIICSDGLTDMVDRDTIRAILMENRDSSEKVNMLISTALENGGRDNVTVIHIEAKEVSAADVGLKDYVSWKMVCLVLGIVAVSLLLGAIIGAIMLG